MIILLGGTVLPLEQLKFWGIPIFISGITLIAIGLMPYKRLSQLQLKPHEIHYDGEALLFCKQGGALFKIQESSIAKMEYREKEKLYGIAIFLKRPIEEPVKVLQSQFNFEAFSVHSAEHFEQCDLFFPYFSASCCQELLSHLNHLD